MVPEEGVV